MKNIIVILFALLSVNSFSQTREGLIAFNKRNDPTIKPVPVVKKPIVKSEPGKETRETHVDFNNINKKFLETLMIEKCNGERDKFKQPHVIFNPVCSLAAQHHSEYMLHYNILNHDESYNGFNGQFFDYYHDENVPEGTIGSYGITFSDRLDHFTNIYNKEKNSKKKYYAETEICRSLGNNIYPNFSYTYDEFAYMLVHGYIKSKLHYEAMTQNNVKYCSFNIAHTFKDGRLKLYLTGLFAIDEWY
jgi:hypothetical protein